MPDDQFTYSKNAPPKASERLYNATVKKYGAHDVPAQVSAYSAESVIMRLSVHGEDRLLGQTSELIIDVDSAQKLMNDMSREYGVARVNLTTSKYYQPSPGTVGAYYEAGPDRSKPIIFQKKYTDFDRDWVQLSTLIHEHAHHVAGHISDEDWSHSRGHGSDWKAQSWDMYREYLGFDDDAARRLTAKVTGETVGAAPRRRLAKTVNPKNYDVKVRWRRPSRFDPRPVHFTAEQWEPMRKGLAKVSRSVNADVKKLMVATDMEPGGSTRALAFEAKNALRDYRVDQLIAEVKGLPPPAPPKKLVNIFKPMGDKTPIGGVQLPKKTAVKFEKAVRTSFLDPFVKNTHRKLMDIAAVNQEWYAIRAQLGTPSGLPSVDRSVVARQLGDVERAHLRKTAEVFRKSIGVDIVPYLSRPEVAEFMDRRVGESVALINTIPARHHKGLADRIRKQQLRETPFDQQRLQKLLSEQYQVSGYNLRRITRDQTSKTVGSLSQIRQAQVGVEEYDWSDSSDSRVRPTHRANNGKRFSWAEPPPTGHPGQDILCRCVARPVVTAETVNRLQGEQRETKPRTRPRDDKLPDTGQPVPVGNPLFDDPEFVDAIRRAADKLSNKYSQMEIPQVISNVLGSPSMRGHIYKDVVDVATRDINRLLYAPRGRVAAKLAPADLPDLAGKRMSDPSVVDAVHRLRADGQSHASIADQLGRWGVVTARGVAPKRYTITAILKKFPVPRDVPAAPLRLAGRSVADLEVVAEVHRLRAAGDTHAAIAKKLADMGVVTASGGVPKRYTVTSVLRKHPKPPVGVRAPGTPTPKPVTPPTPTPTVPSTLVGKTVNDLDVIAEIHRLRATGQSHAAIAKQLADRGVTTATGGVPKRYTVTSVLKKHPTPPKPTTPTPSPKPKPKPKPPPDVGPSDPDSPSGLLKPRKPRDQTLGITQGTIDSKLDQFPIGKLADRETYAFESAWSSRKGGINLLQVPVDDVDTIVARLNTQYGTDVTFSRRKLAAGRTAEYNPITKTLHLTVENGRVRLQELLHEFAHAVDHQVVGKGVKRTARLFHAQEFRGVSYRVYSDFLGTSYSEQATEARKFFKVKGFGTPIKGKPLITEFGDVVHYSSRGLLRDLERKVGFRYQRGQGRLPEYPGAYLSAKTRELRAVFRKDRTDATKRKRMLDSQAKDFETARKEWENILSPKAQAWWEPPPKPTPKPPPPPATPAPPPPPRKVPPIRTDRDYREWRQQEFPSRSWAERMISGGEPIFYHTQREAIRARAAKRAPRFTADQQKLIDAIENEAKQLTTQQPLYRGVALRKRSGDDWAKLWDAQAPKTGEVFEFHSPNPFSFSKVVAEDRTGLGNYVLFEVDPGVVKLRGGVLREHEAVVAASQKFRVVSVSKKVDRYGSTGWTYRLEPVSDIRVPKPPGTIAAPGRSVTEVADAVAAHKATVGTAKVNQEAIIGAIHDLKRGGMSNKTIADQMHSWGVTTATGKQPKPYTIAAVLRRHPVTRATPPTPPPVPVPTGPSPQLVQTIHEMRARMGTSPDVPDAIASLLKDPKFKNVYDISPSGLSADDVAAILATPPKTMTIPSSIGYEVERLRLASHNRGLVESANRVNADMKRARATVADRLGSAANVDNLQQALQSTFREDRVSQYIAMKPAILKRAIRDNEIKNKIQTGTGAFIYSGEYRFRVERRLFNNKRSDIRQPQWLPKYGFIASRDRINAAHILDNLYGSNFVRLKPKVRNRSTITLGDSLNENSSKAFFSPAVPLNKPTASVAQRVVGRGDLRSKTQIDAAQKWGKTHDFNDLMGATGRGRGYVETQVFGELTFDDVDAILVESRRVQKSLQRLLKKSGYGHIEVISSGQHQRLYKIANGSYEAMSSLSPKDVQRLGDYYINKIWAEKTGKWAIEQINRSWNRYPAFVGIAKKVESLGWAKAPIELRRQFLEEFYRLKALKGNGPMPKWGWDDFRVSHTNFTSDVLAEDLLEFYPDPIY